MKTKVSVSQQIERLYKRQAAVNAAFDKKIQKLNTLYVFGSGKRK